MGSWTGTVALITGARRRPGLDTGAAVRVDTVCLET